MFFWTRGNDILIPKFEDYYQSLDMRLNLLVQIFQTRMDQSKEDTVQLLMLAQKNPICM